MNEEVNYYKVSYVVRGGEYTGGIVNVKTEPKIGDQVTFGGHQFEIIELEELMPPNGDFGFLHATCKVLDNIH